MLKKRVLLVNDFLDGGGAENVFKQTYSLMEKLFTVRIFYGSKRQKKNKQPLAYIYSKKFENALIDEFEHFKPHIVHFHNYYHLLTPSVLMAVKCYRNKGGKIKVVFTAHDYHIICPNSGFYYFTFFSKTLRKFKTHPSFWQLLFLSYDHRGILFSNLKKLQWINAYVLKRLHHEIDVIISPSNFLLTKLKNRFGNKKSYAMIRNSVDFTFNSHRQTNRKNGKIRLLFMGRLSFEKGLVELITSLARTRLSDFQLDIYGSGEHKEIIANAILSSRLQKQVFLKGFISHQEIAEIIKNYDALILPSKWYENAPLSIVEAAWNGLRIIVPNYGGLKEMAELCGGYFLYNPDFPDSLEMALKRCKQEIDTKEVLDRNFDFLSKIFGTKAYMEQIQKVYLQN